MEKETNINFNKNDDYAEVYTNQVKVINRLNKINSKFPKYCIKKEKNFYLVDKSLIIFKNPRMISSEIRQKLILNLKK